MAERKYTLVEKRGAVAKITINRPEKRNALSRDAIREMLAVFEELRNDDSICRCATTGPATLLTAPGGIFRVPHRGRENGDGPALRPARLPRRGDYPNFSQSHHRCC
jgi:1,4-dihydroxy-2-naphthoyl-CoA synthase